MAPGKESKYSYSTRGNRDRLSKFNEEICIYDDLGNPIVYRNKDMEWSHLSSLVKYDGVSFKYDASGLRLSKSRGDNRTKFFWASGRLIAERRTHTINDLELGDHIYKCGSGCAPDCTDHDAYSSVNKTDITYLQGTDGIAGFIVSKKGDVDRTYYYRKNVRGDITHILDVNGNVKGEYVYDAWGNHIIIRDDDGIASLNPFRYRGYYYGAETNLYYLRSRYYDPETGRFINADDVGVFEESQGNINGLNLYAYCSNNPIMFCDPTGKIFGLIKKGVNAIVGTVTDVVNSVCNWVDDNLELVLTLVVVAAVVAVTIATAGVGGVAAGILIGAALGAASGAALDVISQGFANGFDNINWGSVGAAALVGGALGGIGGGIGGGINRGLTHLRSTVVINGQRVAVYRGGNSMILKNKEYKVLADGSKRGVSVNIDPAQVQNFGGAYRVTNVPKGLKVVQQGKNPSHFEIIPKTAITPEKFQLLLNKIILIAFK